MSEKFAFKSRYAVTGEKIGISFEKPTMTQQQFKDDADINNIIAKFEVTGVLGDPLQPATRMPQFGDFSEMPSYQEAQNVLVTARNAFMSLPSEVRERFGNDPEKYFDFVQNLKEGSEEYVEAVRLGIVDKPVEHSPEVPQPVADGKTESKAE